MTKRLIVGAAVMTLPALALAAGSANAEPEPANAGVATTPDVVINEIGVDLLDAVSGDGELIDGSFIELKNTTSQAVSLDGWNLRVCDTTTDRLLVSFDSSHVIDPAVSEFFIIADSTFSGSGGIIEDMLVSSFGYDQSDGAVRLHNASIPDEHNVKWGAPAFLCSGFTDAGVTPDDDNSLQLNTAPPPMWCALPPTPKAANGSC